MAQAAGPETIRGVKHCEVFERSLLLFDRRSALVGQVQDAARKHDEAQFFEPGAVTETGPDAPGCAALADLIEASALPDPADLARALDEFPALIVVRGGDAARIDVFANVPKLSRWASDPFVPIAGFDRRDGLGPDLAGEIASRLEVAARFAASITLFLDGDLERATDARPPSDRLAPLARAWMSGIPVALPGAAFSLAGDGAVWDELPSRGAKRPFDLIVDIARGDIAPATAMKLSVPANDVICDSRDVESAEDVRWAGFVSGFWRVLERGDELQPDDRLSALSPIIGAGRTCFDATLHPFLSSMPESTGTGRLVSDLDRLVSFSFAAPSWTERRQQLAAEMLAALVASALVQADEEDDDDSSPGPREDADILQCHGKEVLGADPVIALLSHIDPDPSSPLGAILAASRALFVPLPEGQEDPAHVERFLSPGVFEWLRSYDDLVPDLIERASAQNAELGDLLFERLSVPSLSGRISKIAEVFLFSDDESFAEKAPELKANLRSFERQSQLANHILAAAFGGAFRSAFGGQLENAVQQPVKRRAYDRFVTMFPNLSEDESLQFLWRSSDEDKIRVAGIDLLHLFFAVTGGKPADAFPVGRRNPWTVFAPDTQSLPEIPIPAIDGFAPMPALLVATSAIAHATLDTDPDSDSFLLGMDRIDLASLNGPAVVWLDFVLRSYLEDDGTLDVQAYHPSPAARRIFANLPDDLAGALTDEAGASSALDGLWQGRISSWTAALALGWETVVRPYAEERLSEAADADAAATVLGDFELGARVAGAYLFPAEIDAPTAVTDLHDRLLEEPGWPDALTRLAARAALDLLSAPDTEDTDTRDANRAAMLAEFDKLVSPQARQRLIDAGFLPAAIAGLPLRIAFVARDNAGLVGVPDIDVVRAAIEEIRAFDYTTASTEGPLRDLAEVLLVYQSSRNAGPEADGNTAKTGWDRIGREVLDLLENVRNLESLIDPSAEAKAVGQGIALDEGLFGSSRTAVDADAQTAAASLAALRQLLETCPNLAPTLAPVEILLEGRAGVPVDVPSRLDRLQDAVENRESFLTGTIKSQVTMMGVELNIQYAPGLPTQIADVPTGVFTFGLGASIAGLGTPWTVESSLGLARRPEIGSLPFAHALTLAEAAADDPDREAFARLLFLTETLATGGDPFDDNPQAPPVQIASQTLTDELYLGIDVPGIRPLQPLIGYATSVETRLLRLAARAEQRAMPALARRIAGLSVALAVELPTEPIEPAEGDPADPEWEEDFRTDNALRAQRRDLIQTVDTGVYTRGLHLARLISAGVVAVPKSYARWVLCEGASSDGGLYGCPDLPAFTRAVSQASSENEVPIEERQSLLPTGGDEDMPACERLARHAFLGGTEGEPPVAGSDCLTGLLGLDHAAIPDAQDLATDLSAYLDHGAVPLLYLSSPATLDTRAKKGAANVRLSEAAHLFRDAARVSIGLLDFPETVFRYANLYVFAAIADSAAPELSDDLRKAAAGLAPSIGNETAREILLRLSQDGARIEDTDRAFSAQAARAFYNRL